jgi:signal peptidase I
VIGEPGDKVEIRSDGLVYVNDIALDEPYLYADEAGGAAQPTTAPPEDSTWTVPSDELFLMGDHRQDSTDSRSFGAVPISRVIGRAWLRYWPLDAIGILQTPTYQRPVGFDVGSQGGEGRARSYAHILPDL